MLNIVANSVTHAFDQVVDLFQNDSSIIECPSRVGDVWMYPFPVCVTYLNPWSNVLTNTERDANVFFHLYEAMWMLAGRNDLASLQHYVSTFDNYSDDGMTLNGAYGYRWRHHLTLPEGTVASYSNDLQRWVHSHRKDSENVDQLEILINHLKNNPNSRRAVLQMWNVDNDLLKIESSKDVCCNLSVCFSIRENVYLDMTVFNRSNDAIWGTTGANAVHFSFLQAYVASHLPGVNIGVYYQITNNLHVYKEIFQKSKEAWIQNRGCVFPVIIQTNPSLIQSTDTFEKELQIFVDRNFDYPFEEPFIDRVAAPLMKAFEYHKQRDYSSAFDQLRRNGAGMYWKRMASSWLSKREKLWQANTKN